MEVLLEEKDAADWVYRGEGAANIVLAYNGSTPAFVGKVLRIPKAPRNVSDGEDGCSALTKEECLLWKEIKDLVLAPTKEFANERYIQDVIKPLLGSAYVDVGTHALVSREFLESVEKNILFQRPSWRVDATKVNLFCNSALLIPDHSVFPPGNLKGEFCISVEIKPKCGFLPVSRFISEGNSVKKSISRFKMHQLLKLREKVVSEISEYDPLDLFSGSRERVDKAIRSLFFTPQNNFGVFLNGSLIYGGLGGRADYTSCMTGEAFEDILKCIIQADDGLRTAYFLYLVTEALFSSGLLDEILKVQKLDIFDIEGAIHAYYDIVSRSCNACRDLGEDKVLDKYKYLHSLPLDESLKIVKDYLIAATVKDLSIMIAFRPTAHGNMETQYSHVFLESTNQIFDYKVSLIDLDMKPLKKMEQYYQLDQKIVSCYAQMVKKEHQLENLEVFRPIELHTENPTSK